LDPEAVFRREPSQVEEVRINKERRCLSAGERIRTMTTHVIAKEGPPYSAKAKEKTMMVSGSGQSQGGEGKSEENGKRRPKNQRFIGHSGGRRYRFP